MQKPTTLHLTQHIDDTTVTMVAGESSLLSLTYGDASAKVTIFDPEPKDILALVQNLLSFHRVLLANDAKDLANWDVANEAR